MTRFMVSLVVLGGLLQACSSASPAVDAGAGGSLDAGPGDAGPNDAGGLDAGQPDAGQSDAGQPDAGALDAGTADGGLLAARPYKVVVPVGYTPSTPLPLVVLLHGYTATAAAQDAYFNLSDAAQRKNFLLALPDGLVDPTGQHYWNATDACCAFAQQPDDVAYLTAVIDDMKARYAVDAKRVFLIGHSNGAFMSHRMACDRSDRVAAIVSLAGAVWADTAKCNPTNHVSVLQVHGTLDAVISYNGGVVAVSGAQPYPSAHTTVTTWAGKNSCTGTLTGIGGDLDITDVPFAETKREGFTGCPADGAAELWSMQGGSHIPVFVSPTIWSDSVIAWLMAHPRP